MVFRRFPLKLTLAVPNLQSDFQKSKFFKQNSVFWDLVAEFWIFGNNLGGKVGQKQTSIFPLSPLNLGINF